MFFNSPSDFEDRISIRAAEFCEHIISEMGAELHDDVIQKLTALSFYLERIERSADEPAEVLNLVTRMRGDFENVTQTVRGISRRLHPVHRLDASFHSDVKTLCDGMQPPGNATVTVTSSGAEKHLDHDTFMYMFRIIQELVHNAFKHSAAWKVDVAIVWTDDRLFVRVEDDGTRHMNIEGITTELKTKYNTLQMRSRAINANIRYDKGRKGLLVEVELPLREATKPTGTDR